MLARLLNGPGSPLRDLRRSLEDPAGSQRRFLKRVVARAASTEWGRGHRFDLVLRHPDPVAEYQRRVPLTDAAALAPFIGRACEGEPDVLWPGRIRRFAIPGGTQSGERLVPISSEAMRHMARAAATPGWNYLASRPGAAAILRGKWLTLPGEIVRGRPGHGVTTGSISAFLALAARPFAAPWILSLPREEMFQEGWNRKLDLLAGIAVRNDVRALVMLPSWAPVLFDRVLARAGIAPGRGALRRLWPDLRVFFTGGVALSPHRPVLEWYLGPGVDYVESYSASEGFIAFQEDVDSPDLLLHLSSGLFYEFVPHEPGPAGPGPRCTVATIETGIPYAIYLTDAGALWSFELGDVVRFTSTRPPRLRVVGRTHEQLDRHGERLRAEQAHAAIARLQEIAGEPCRHGHITYDASGAGAAPRHHWILEFDRAPGDLAGIAVSIDRILQDCNGGYRMRRAAEALDLPRVTIVPRGTFESYARRTRRAIRAQTKFLALSDDDGIARGLLGEDGGRGAGSDASSPQPPSREREP